MKTLLTLPLLGFLIERGYTHCLAKTQNITKVNCYKIITLKPIKGKPLASAFPLGYDICYKLTREPMEMASRIDDTQIYVCLDSLQNRSKNSFNINSLVFEKRQFEVVR